MSIVEASATLSKADLPRCVQCRGKVCGAGFILEDQAAKPRSLRYIGFVGACNDDTGLYDGVHRFEVLSKPDLVSQTFNGDDLWPSNSTTPPPSPSMDEL